MGGARRGHRSAEGTPATADQRAPGSRAVHSPPADTRVELCTLLHSSAPLALRVHHPAANAARPQHARPMRLLGAQAGKHVSVRVQPRGKVPGNYQAQQTDEGPCNAKGDAEFNWRMLWPMSVLEKAPSLYIAVSNYGSNEMIGESLAP